MSLNVGYVGCNEFSRSAKKKKKRTKKKKITLFET